MRNILRTILRMAWNSPAFVLSYTLANLSYAQPYPPSNPSASQKTKDVLHFFNTISGKGIVTGQESMIWDHGAQPPYESKRDSYVKSKNGGKSPGIYVADFGDINAENLLPMRENVVRHAIQRWKEGALVSIQWHAVQPEKPEWGGFDAMHIPGSTYKGIDAILTAGSASQTEWFRRMDVIAGYLKKLKEAGVVVVWRPFHEMNGDWFWWSLQPRYKDLWIQMHDRFTKHHQLDNLLWMFSVNWYPDGKDEGAKYYPGDAYVDMLGVDVYLEYGHKYSKVVHDDLLKLGKGRPIAITENGQMPDFEILKRDMPRFCYFATWFSFETPNHGNTDALYTKNYGDPWAITADEIKLVTAPALAKSPRLRSHKDPRKSVFDRYSLKPILDKIRKAY